MNPSLSAKLRFFVVYGLSVGLIITIVSLLMGMGQSNTQAPTTKASTATDESLWQANKYLHGRVAGLNSLYASSLQDPARRYRNAAAVQKEEAAFAASLDSVQANIGSKVAALQPAWEEMVLAFRQSVQSRRELLQAYTGQPVATPTSTTDPQQLTDLQQQLQQRDATIADLNRQLTTRPATTAATNADAELARSNASLRASVEKLRGENEALNRSYKAVVDDHKRVLAQLQSARKQ